MVTTRKLLLFLVLLLFIPLTTSISTSESSLGVFQQNNDIELLQICSKSNGLCDGCNISSVKYPNSSIILSNVAMTKRTGDFNYTLISNYTSALGEYRVNGLCEKDGEIQIWNYEFEVTVNGKEKPSGGVIVLFTLLFLVIVTGLLSLLIYNIFRMVEWNFDVKDLIFNMSAYFALFVVYILGKEYLGNSFVNGFLEWVIASTAISNVILPVVAFIMSYFKGQLYGGKNG